jgi:hypothetical protein
MYEITFAGRAGSTLQAEFDDCEVIVGAGTTTLRAEQHRGVRRRLPSAG